MPVQLQRQTDTPIKLKLDYVTESSRRLAKLAW